MTVFLNSADNHRLEMIKKKTAVGGALPKQKEQQRRRYSYIHVWIDVIWLSFAFVVRCWGGDLSPDFLNGSRYQMKKSDCPIKEPD